VKVRGSPPRHRPRSGEQLGLQTWACGVRHLGGLLEEHSPPYSRRSSREAWPATRSLPWADFTGLMHRILGFPSLDVPKEWRRE